MEKSPSPAPRSRCRSTIQKLTILACAALLSLLFTYIPSPGSEPVFHSTDFASEWEDNVWPYREQTAWDISTDFAYPRTLSYDVEEGTWLRLDVHPISGEIVFDMLGDLYCLAPPGTTAHPILVGVPYDSDPHFSPDGDRLVFRSDAELGVENIWVMPWTGCEAMDVRRAAKENRLRRLASEGRLQGQFTKLLAIFLCLINIQRAVSPTRRSAGCPTPASIPLAPK